MNTLYIDIETLPSETPPDREDIKVPDNYKKQETIDKFIDGNVEKQWHSQGLDSMVGRIFCVGIACNDDDPVVFTDLKDFDQFIMSLDGPLLWVGHNILQFDAKWLIRHGIKKGLRFPTRINTNRYKGNVQDTMKIWACDDYKDYTKLDDLARFLSVGHKTEGIDGSQVWEFYKSGRTEEICEYCKGDVRITRSVYKKISQYIIST